ncbi:MAG TPA: glycosyltransferase family 61 protein [Pyrinomonadaceae bacterium]|nr:glycosyltransferase family 61 protein [Pyrinomonadaceae bacterium]
MTGEGTLLLEGETATRRLPENLRDEDLRLFSHALEARTPACRLLRLRETSASGEGLLFKGLRVLPESFAHPSTCEAFTRRRRGVLKFLAANRLARRRVRLDEPCLWITDDWSHGYFHWFADALPRLLAARDYLGEAVLLLPARYRGLEFVASSLRAFSPREVRFIGEGEVYVCRELLLPTQTAPSGDFNESLIKELRTLLVEFYGGAEDTRGAFESVYISRARAPKRRVENEEEVVSVVREFGFEVVYAEDLTFAEQVRLHARARRLVSIHGAGLTNMLFMPTGGGVLELRKEGHAYELCYFGMASALDLRYFYQPCPPVRPDDTGMHAADLRVDTSLLASNLRRMSDA